MRVRTRAHLSLLAASILPAGFLLLDLTQSHSLSNLSEPERGQWRKRALKLFPFIFSE